MCQAEGLGANELESMGMLRLRLKGSPKVGRRSVPIYRHGGDMSALGAGALDAQFFHFGLEGGALHVERFGGAAFAADAPSGFF